MKLLQIMVYGTYVPYTREVWQCTQFYYSDINFNMNYSYERIKVLVWNVLLQICKVSHTLIDSKLS